MAAMPVAVTIIVGSCWRSSVTAQRARRRHRRGEGWRRGSAARCHRASGQRGVVRESPNHDHGRQRSISSGQPACGGLHHHVLIGGLQPGVRVGVQVPAGVTTAIDADMNVGSPDSPSSLLGRRPLGSMLSAQMRPYVRCGLTIVPADPKVDSKILVPHGSAPSGLSVGNRPQPTIRTIAPAVCGDEMTRAKVSCSESVAVLQSGFLR